MNNKSQSYWRGWLGMWMLAVSPLAAFAHGGEDHSAEQAPVVAAGAGMVARTMQAGEWEIMIKHPVLKPDKELAARVFVTKHDTNEPVERASVTVTVTDVGGAPTQVTATAAGNTPGVYELKLPPMPQGAYKLAVRVGASGANETVQFGAIQVARASVAEAESVNGWGRTGLIILAALIGLGVVGVGVMRLMQSARNRKTATA